MKTQRALRADPQLAAKAAQRRFSAEEASLIAYEMARDAPFYNATISEEMVDHISRFAREIGALEGEVRYSELVASLPGSGTGKVVRARAEAAPPANHTPRSGKGRR
jgi:NitT/TauT family transport system substrate-binding protein